MKALPPALGNGLAVNEDLELPALAGLRGQVDVETVLDDRSETRRGALIASGGAVTNLDVHDASRRVGVSETTLRQHTSSRRWSSPATGGGQVFGPEWAPVEGRTAEGSSGNAFRATTSTYHAGIPGLG